MRHVDWAVVTIVAMQCTCGARGPDVWNPDYEEAKREARRKWNERD